MYCNRLHAWWSTQSRLAFLFKLHAGGWDFRLYDDSDLKKYHLSRSSKKYAKQNLNVETISYKRVVQEGLRPKNFYL